MKSRLSRARAALRGASRTTRHERGCDETRLHLLDYQRGRLDAAAHEAVRGHLDTCPECAREDAAEHALSEALDRRLPQYPAPLGLKRQLADRWTLPRSGMPSRRRWLRPSVAASALAATLLVGALVRTGSPPVLVDDRSAVPVEAVNDHLRIVEPGRRLDVQSDDVHQVRPWFVGRLDFAPVVPFAGDAEFPLRGGAIERFLDRRAAVFVYGRRLHVVSLLVFRSDGLAWPPGDEGRGAAMLVVRGFNLLVWRSGDLGYALVSDLNVGELAMLRARVTPPATRP